MTDATDRFAEDRDKYHVYEITEDHLTLVGGGDFHDATGDRELYPDDDTYAEAKKLAEKYGMEITGARGEWYGWSEYTPDPGDVSVFTWVTK